MKNLLKTLISVIIILALTACGNQANKTEDATQAKLSGTIKIDGSSTVYPVTEAVAEEFLAEAPDVRVTVGVSGTGGGFKKFGRGEIDISDASRPIKDKEKLACEENNIKYVELTVAYDGLAVLINPENDWVDYFTVEELKKLWEPSAEGTIMKWSDIREGWPEETINLYGPDVASGTYDYFTEVIIGESGASRADYTNSADDNILVQGIATDKYALGFFGLAYYEENKDKLNLVGVDNGSGAIIPTMETVSNNTYAPLSRPIFIYVNNTAVKRSEVVRFVEFYFENATDLVQDVGYIPLPEEKYQVEVKEFKEFVAANK
ncbi:MAG: PstS family phosphate ABC transporter substrate-binding protein [Bacteroidetes bacterium]|nr:PstS family phosphate ABC transporter substrate-binding protein [Bacteroidota bacterium]